MTKTHISYTLVVLRLFCELDASKSIFPYLSDIDETFRDVRGCVDGVAGLVTITGSDPAPELFRWICLKLYLQSTVQKTASALVKFYDLE